MQILDSAWTSETKDPAELQLFSSSVTKFATSTVKRFVTLLCSSGLTYMFKKPTWGLYHKTYYGRNLRISVISKSTPGKPLQPSLVFARKAGAYQSEAHFRCSTLG